MASAAEVKKVPVILMSERHLDSKCHADQLEFFAKLEVPPSEVLLVKEGFNPCIDGFIAEGKGYKVLNEYTLPDSMNVIGVSHILWGANPGDADLNKEAANQLVRRIPEGPVLLKQLYDIDHFDFMKRDPLARTLVEKLRASDAVPDLVKPIMDAMLTNMFVMELPGTAGDDTNVNTRVIFLRDKLLVNSIERFLESDPTIQLVVIIRGAYHAVYTRHFIGKSSRLALSNEVGIRANYTFVNYNAVPRRSRRRASKKRNRRTRR